MGASIKFRALLIGGSLNQTTMLHRIAQHLANDFDCFFTPYYGDAFINSLAERGYLDFSIAGPGSAFYRQTMEYLESHNLDIDLRGQQGNYNLAITCQDLIVPSNIRNSRIVLVQEGMTDPENFLYYLVKWLRLPRYFASTSTTGLSHSYQKFCVASPGYRDHFIHKGVDPKRIAVTGIPNFDNCAQHLSNDFPYRNYALVATSDSRETFKFENRRKFIEKSITIAAGRPLIFKLHPNENHDRAIREIKQWAPGSLVFTSGNIAEMIANCDVLITRFSTVVYIGLALGKEVYSDFDIETLRRMTPIQNGGTSAENIAHVCRSLFGLPSQQTVNLNKLETGIAA